MQETCPLEKKTLWATKDVHDLHESALNFVSFLVETAGKCGNNALQELKRLLERLETTVEQAAVNPITERTLTTKDDSLQNDFRAMQLFARKATGGQFAFDKAVKKTRANLSRAHGFDHFGKYVAPGVAMTDRIVCKTPSIEGAAADGEDVEADSESEAAQSESDDGADGDAVVNVHEMDDSDYFLPNVKAILEKHDSPESDRERLMVGKFQDFIEDNMRSPSTECVFAESKRRFAGDKDCLVVSRTERGLKIEVVGDKEKILEKFEAMRVSLHENITNERSS